MTNLLLKTTSSLVVIFLFYAALFRILDIKVSDISLKRNPEKLTELFFSDHTKLPKQVELGTRYDFEFTTKSLEEKDFNYTYEVNLVVNNRNTRITNGSFSLKKNEEVKIPVSFTVRSPFTRGKIEVALQEKNEKIHFYFEET